MVTLETERVEYPVPDCWNTQAWERKEKRKECVTDTIFDDTFCFELGTDKDPYDHYYFDGQKRGLPNYGIVEHEADQCVELCRDKVGGKVVASEYILQRAPLLFSPIWLMAILSP